MIHLRLSRLPRRPDGPVLRSLLEQHAACVFIHELHGEPLQSSVGVGQHRASARIAEGSQESTKKSGVAHLDRHLHNCCSLCT